MKGSFSLKPSDLVPGTVILLPTNILETSPYQIREDYGEIEELALSICEHGQQNPIRVWFSATAEGAAVVGKERYRVFIHDGNRRVRAIRLAQEKGWLESDFLVRAIVISEFSNQAEALISQFTLNNSGLAFSRLETARLVKALIDSGLTQQEVAKRLGKSQPWVSNQLQILKADKEILDRIERLEVSPTQVLRALQGNKRKRKVKESEVREAETVDLRDWEQISQLKDLRLVTRLLLENSHSLESVNGVELRVTVNKFLFNRLEELVM